MSHHCHSSLITFHSSLIEMAIKFFCKCGKKLKARDEMAGRRSMCPRCGSPVGIPSTTPTHPGTTLGPMSIQDRLRFWKTHLPSETLPKSLLPEEPDGSFNRDALPDHSTQTPHADEATRKDRKEKPPAIFDAPLDRALVRQVIGARRSFALARERHLETRWYQCLLYPFRAWPLVFGLSGALALCAGMSTFVHRQTQEFAQGISVLGIYTLWACIPLMILSYSCGFLDCVMASALAGEFRHVRWPGRRLDMALKSCFVWAVCFLAGPAVPIALALTFWLQAGEMEIVDWLILTELVVVAMSYWLLVLLTVNAKDGLANVNPMRVMELIGRLGWGSIGVALGTAVVAILHVLAAIAAITDLQRDESWGWFALIYCSWSGMFWTTFLFRWLGVWCHRLELTARISKSRPRMMIQ
jgi:hypothetical protein